MDMAILDPTLQAVVDCWSVSRPACPTVMSITYLRATRTRMRSYVIGVGADES